MGSPGAGRLGYEDGHIPGAIFLDLDTELAAATGPGRHPLPEPADLSARLEAVGIGDADDVVVYDDVGGWIAARLWWMLDDLGHRRVRVLDGGLPAWLAAGFPTTTAEPGPRPRGHLHLHDRVDQRDRSRGCRRRARPARPARCPRRGRATAARSSRSTPSPAISRPPGTRRPTPTSARIDDCSRRPSWPSGSMRSGSAPRARSSPRAGAASRPASPASPCGSPGLPDPILYPGSYSDWSRAGLPVAVGPEPGEPPTGQPASG